MVRSIHNWVSEHIHAPSNLDKVILFLPLAVVWLFTLPIVGLMLSIALCVLLVASFIANSTYDTGGIIPCVLFGLIAVLHVVDIIKSGLSDVFNALNEEINNFIDSLDEIIMGSRHDIITDILRIFIAIPLLKPLKLRCKNGAAWWIGTIWLSFYVGCLIFAILTLRFKLAGPYPDICGYVIAWGMSTTLFLLPRIISMLMNSGDGKKSIGKVIIVSFVLVVDIGAILLAYQFSMGSWVDGIFKPKPFDYSDVSKDELAYLQSVSKDVNEQLEKWRNGSSVENWENNDGSISINVRSLASEENESDDVEKTIEVLLKKELGGCPKNSFYEEKIIKSKQNGIMSVESEFRNLRYSSFTASNDNYLNCWEFLSLGEDADAKMYSTPRTETLYLSGVQWGAPATFNPLAESWLVAWPVGGRFNLMYEPLVTYNTLNGQTEDLLGHLVEEISNNDSIVVDLNTAAKWSDGKQVNSNDVKFVFMKGSINTSEQIVAIHIDTLATKPVVQERISFIIARDKRNNPLVVRDLLQSVRIVPAHVFEPLIKKNGISKIKKMLMDVNPIVSGPYNLKDYSSEYIALERRDDYWGNAAIHNGQLPAPKYIVHPIYNSNSAANVALRESNLDASQNFVPRIWYKKAFGIHTWFDEPPYFRPGAMPMLVINTLKEPLNDKRFRRALATAIDYNALRQFAVSNYTSTLKPGLIMPTDLEGKYIVDEDLEKYGVNLGISDEAERLTAVKQILSEAGFKSVFNDDGTLDHMENAKGERLPTLYITSPNGWTDWKAMVTIAVEGMRKAGIDIREGFVDGGSYWPAMGLGNFDLVMHKPVADVTPSLPWSRFNEIMASRDWQPLGAWAGVNIGRYNQPGSEGFRPEVDQLLSAIPLMTDSVEIAKAYRELNKIFMEDQPSIPLVYLPEQFYEFSDRVWTNWPTAENPYAPAQLPWEASGTKILWNLKSVKR